MKNTRPIVEAPGKKNIRVVPEASTALSTGMFHPIGGLDPDMSRSARGPKTPVGFWSRFRAARS